MPRARLHRLRPAASTAPVSPAVGTVARPPRRRWRWLALAALGLLAVGSGLWLALRPTPVTVAALQVGEAVETVYASGIVEYVRHAALAPLVTAPIRRAYADEGQTVRAGQTLAQLDDGPQAGATLQFEAQAALARAQADRAHRLYAAGFGAKAADEDAQALRRAAEAAAAGARAHLADYVIRAPFAGRVLRRDAEPGDLATVGTPLFILADPRSLRVTTGVDERDIGRIAVGQDAVVRADAFPGRIFRGRITEVTPQGDAAGRVFRVRVSLPQGTPLRSGMTVETNLVTARRAHALLAPGSALRDGAVWTISHGRAHRQPVRTGVVGAARVEILAGLEPDATVVTNPPTALREGTRVTAKGR